MNKVIVFKGIELNVEWTRTTDIPIDQLPTTAGLYAQIHWRSNGVRIGEAANIRSRHQQARSWFNAMHAGTAKEDQLRRNNVFCQAAKRDGESGFGHCIISTDPRLQDKVLRIEIEEYLFIWVAHHPVYQDFNFQAGYQNSLEFFTLSEVEANRICSISHPYL